jgi:hypothetical protein
MSDAGTNRTNRADLMMSVSRGNPEVAFGAARTVFDPLETSRAKRLLFALIDVK